MYELNASQLRLYTFLLSLDLGMSLPRDAMFCPLVAMLLESLDTAFPLGLRGQNTSHKFLKNPRS